MVDHPEFGGLFPKKILEKIEAKIPHDMPAVVKNKEGLGFKYGRSKGKEVIRIDKGNPGADFAHQQCDHVRVNYNGQVIGRNGEPILSTPQFPSPKNHPDAHIPLSECVEWKTWNHPIGRKK